MMRSGASFCPGILNPVPTKDGLLIRIRIPGGVIQAGQLKTAGELSRSFADGEIEITSRANLQLRAIQSEDVQPIGVTLANVGLLPSGHHDRVRNIVASPFAGIDKEDIIDVRGLVRDLDARLQTEPRFAQLHPKFSFGFHGGGRRFSRDQDDLSLEAVNTPAGPRFQLLIAGQDLGLTVPAEESVSYLLALAERCIDLANEASIPTRAKKIVALPGGTEKLLRGLEHLLSSNDKRIPPTVFAETPVGVEPSVPIGTVTICPTVPLGRITAAQAISLATIATKYNCHLRFAPWRGIVLSGIPENSAMAVVTRLESDGLSCWSQDGFRGIAACAGSAGCDASLADVRTHAVTLAEHLAGRDIPKGWTVNLSGCEKQCARRHGATAEMIATDSGYTLKIKGNLIASGCSPEFALHAIVALNHKESSKEVLANELR
jgi:precorrin-3B synthase